jgi:hypothetical protein
MIFPVLAPVAFDRRNVGTWCCPWQGGASKELLGHIRAFLDHRQGIDAFWNSMSKGLVIQEVGDMVTRDRIGSTTKEIFLLQRAPLSQSPQAPSWSREPSATS